MQRLVHVVLRGFGVSENILSGLQRIFVGSLIFRRCPHIAIGHVSAVGGFGHIIWVDGIINSLLKFGLVDLGRLLGIVKRLLGGIECILGCIYLVLCGVFLIDHSLRSFDGVGQGILGCLIDVFGSRLLVFAVGRNGRVSLVCRRISNCLLERVFVNLGRLLGIVKRLLGGIKSILGCIYLVLCSVFLIGHGLRSFDGICECIRGGLIHILGAVRQILAILRDRRAVLVCRRIRNSLVKSSLVDRLNLRFVGSLICCIRSCRNRRGIPTVECVSVLIVISLGGIVVRIRRHITFAHRRDGKLGIVVVNPGDGVGIRQFVASDSDGPIARKNGDRTLYPRIGLDELQGAGHVERHGSLSRLRVELRSFTAQVLQRDNKRAVCSDIDDVRRALGISRSANIRLVVIAIGCLKGYLAGVVVGAWCTNRVDFTCRVHCHCLDAARYSCVNRATVFACCERRTIRIQIHNTLARQNGIIPCASSSNGGLGTRI